MNNAKSRATQEFLLLVGEKTFFSERLNSCNKMKATDPIKLLQQNESSRSYKIRIWVQWPRVCKYATRLTTLKRDLLAILSLICHIDKMAEKEVKNRSHCDTYSSLKCRQMSHLCTYLGVIEWLFTRVAYVSNFGGC
jgi:hypothetical protein